jgi:glycerol-3-phosphate acyltransferase PlsY
MSGPLAWLALTYLLAGVPFGLLLTTLHGGELDVRAAGSGNIGTTNVARLYGWRLALLVLAADMGKGLLPVLYAWAMRPEWGIGWLTAVAAAAFIGHCFPIYLGFHGGKGVATGAGAMLAISPLPTLTAMGVWGTTLALSGRSSVASLTATIVLVLHMTWSHPEGLIPALLLAVGVLGTHTSNIRRLLTGTEGAVVQPVRWGRAADPDRAEIEALLDAGPGGGPARPALWREDTA